LITGRYEVIVRDGVFTIPKKLRFYFESESDTAGSTVCWIVEFENDPAGLYFFSSEEQEKVKNYPIIGYKELCRIDARGRVRIPRKLNDRFNLNGTAFFIGVVNHCFIEKDREKENTENLDIPSLLGALQG